MSNKVVYPNDIILGTPRVFEKVTNETYLETAIGVAKWLKRFEVKKAVGKSWAISSGEGSSEGDGLAAKLSDRTLYSGAAGVGYFYVQLYEITNNREYLDEAIEAGEYLLNEFTPELGKKPGIHTGLAGEALFAELLYKKTGDNKYLDYVKKAGDVVYEFAQKEGGAHWYNLIDYMGDGSTVAFWIHLADITGDRKYLDYAKETLDYLASQIVENDDGTINWDILEINNYFSNLPKGGLISNFAHGTAGIVYLFAKYYGATKDVKYLEYARKGFQFLSNIAVREKENDSAIVPYIYWKETGEVFDVFYLSMCHGPVGDAIVAKELYKVTGEEQYLTFYKQLTNALVSAGVPNKRSAGYWNDCVCCGSAGALLHFIDGISFIGDEKYEKLAKETARKLVGDAFKDEKGTRWYNAWTRVIPWNVDSHLGLYIGAAGQASALLSLYAQLENKELTPIVEF